MENYKELLDNAIEEAILEYQHFLYLLDIEPDAFNHLYNIKTPIRKIKDRASGYYDPEKNKIVIDRDTVKLAFEIIQKKPENEDAVMRFLTETVLHEMLHANRTVMLGNSMNLCNLFDLFQYEETKKLLLKEGHDVDLYEDILAETKERAESAYYTKIIPIRANINPDGTFKVVAYNKENNSKYENKKDNDDKPPINYDVYDSIPVDTTPGVEVMFSIGLELNSKKRPYIPDHILMVPGVPNIDGVACSIADYYMSNKEVTDSTLAFGELTIFENFEEVIIETLAQIISKCRREKEFDLKKVTRELAASDRNQMDVRVGAKFISDLGIDFVKWFMLSAYDDCYFNYIEKKFEDKTLNLAIDFSKINIFVLKNENKKEKDESECLPYIKSINNIVKQKIKK